MMMHGLANVKYILDIDFTDGLSYNYLSTTRTNSMHHILSRQANSSSANKEIPDIL